MKNLMAEIKKCEQTKYKKTYKIKESDCDERGKLNQWVLLNKVEDLQNEAAECLKQIAPQYKKDINQVDLRFFEMANFGDKLEFEARFYEVDKRKVELKAFVRKIKPDKTSKRVCRASYVFKAIYEKQIA